MNFTNNRSKKNYYVLHLFFSCFWLWNVKAFFFSFLVHIIIIIRVKKKYSFCYSKHIAVSYKRRIEDVNWSVVTFDAVHCLIMEKIVWTAFSFVFFHRNLSIVFWKFSVVVMFLVLLILFFLFYSWYFSILKFSLAIATLFWFLFYRMVISFQTPNQSYFTCI